ncbi:hypothetical protein DACRYDRAFT_102694 [Dacryopinax primogenitus]|uniref:Uncharacterized protein n=1 Tax=Dacryopinax primogenitus (strain DJM 731) TaxID=1858805 RepID=M5FUS7_DACPD|nr:uncharacterized protein DACRYDRAFT_102694 [Dacryopinax primogenitus]EJT97026.1 hypothetical protein DACRYDRAFT_102694 [Dacryopinax primogenitus]
MGLCVSESTLSPEHILPHHPLYLALVKPCWGSSASPDDPCWPQMIKSSVNPSTPPLPTRAGLLDTPTRSLAKNGSHANNTSAMRRETSLSTRHTRAGPPPTPPATNDKPQPQMESFVSFGDQHAVYNPLTSSAPIYVVPDPNGQGYFFVPPQEEGVVDEMTWCQQIQVQVPLEATPSSMGLPLPESESEGTVTEAALPESLVDRAIEAGRALQACPDIGPIHLQLSKLISRLLDCKYSPGATYISDGLAKRLNKFCNWCYELSSKLRNGHTHHWSTGEVEQLKDFLSRISSNIQELQPDPLFLEVMVEKRQVDACRWTGREADKFAARGFQ